MNIYQEDLYPWLAEEKRFIRRAMDSEKTILGICLAPSLSQISWEEWCIKIAIGRSAGMR